MLYTTLELDGKTCKLRLRAQDCVALERKIGKNPLSIFMGVENGELPTVTDTAAMLHASLQAMEHGYTEAAVYQLIDQWVESGKTLVDLYAVLTDVFVVSGFLPKREETEKNG